MNCPPGALRKIQPCQHFDFSTIILIMNVWPLERQENKLVLFLSHEVCSNLSEQQQEMIILPN